MLLKKLEGKLLFSVQRRWMVNCFLRAKVLDDKLFFAREGAGW